jgi:PAS domain S-box-containing protein
MADGHERTDMDNELSRIVETLPALVWTALPDGRMDFLNHRWCAYTGLRREEACGWGWQRALHPDDLPALLERWRVIMAAGAPWDMEARLRRVDGEYRWFLFRTCPMADASGQVVKWCGMAIDIEDRRRAEGDLRASEGRFRAIVDGLPAVVTLMTADGEFEQANRHMLEYFGTPIEELKRRPTTQSFHPEDRPEVDRRWRESVETGRPYDFEARLRRHDGVYRWFHTRGFPLRDADGRIVLWYLLQTDVDDRKRAEALLVGEKRLLEMVAVGCPLPVVLHALCELVEETVSGSYCGIVLVDPTGTRLQHGAAPSLPDSYNESITGRPVNVDAGPCAMAVYLNAQVICADATSETRWATYAWCPLALAHGLKACWSTPIPSMEGKALGAFAIYYVEPTTPTPQHQALMARFTHIAGIAIERTRREEALKRSEAFLAEAQHLSRTGSFVWRGATDDLTWSKEMYRIYEFDESQPVTIERGRARIHPEDFAIYMEQMARAQREPIRGGPRGPAAIPEWCHQARARGLARCTRRSGTDRTHRRGAGHHRPATGGGRA